MATRLIKPPETETRPEIEEGGPVMSFFEHIEELRKRLMNAVLALAIGMAISFVFANPVLKILEGTYGEKLVLLGPTDSITIFFRVSLLLGAILASPFITYQLLLFILPGLTRNERRWVIYSLPATTFLFLFGVVFTWFLLVPAYISFLMGFQNDVFKVQWTADNYIGFMTSVLFWHGVAFETPIVFYILGKLGAVTARSMLKYWRHATVAASVFAAFIAPTMDPLTMIVITLILVVLYFLSVALVAATSGWKKQSVTASR
jgi:sec-independent protein translocase protein TatC